MDKNSGNSSLSNLDFESPVVHGITLGGDANTIGAMTGAIAGVFFTWNLNRRGKRQSDMINREETVYISLLIIGGNSK